MAINYLNTINLNKNSLESARIHNLGTEPTPDTPGEIYFNTTSQALKITVQTGFVPGSETYAWEEVGSDSVIQGNGIQITPGTGADAGNSIITNTGLITLGVVAGAQNWTIANGINTTTTFASASSNEITVDSPTPGTVRIGLPNDVTISNDLTVSNDMAVDGELSVSNTSEFTGLVTASAGVAITTGTLSAGASTTIDLGANRVTNIADPTAAQDAATKSYVDTAVIGLLEYQGGYNAATNTPALDTNLALSSVGSGGGAISGTFNATTTVGTGSNMTIYVETNANGNIIVARVVNGGSGYTTSSVVSVSGEISGHTGSYFGVQAIPIANIEKGWTYTVTDSGYFYNEKVEPGDVLIAELNAASGQEYWTVVQNNVELASAIQVGIGNAVANPATNRKGISVAYANPTNGTALVGLDILGITTDSATTYAATDYSIPFYSATAVENYKITMADLAPVVSAVTSATGTIAAGATTGTVAHDFGINTMVQTFDTGSGETVFCDIVRDTNSPYSVTATIVGAQTNDITILVQKIG